MMKDISRISLESEAIASFRQFQNGKKDNAQKDEKSQEDVSLQEAIAQSKQFDSLLSSAIRHEFNLDEE